MDIPSIWWRGVYSIALLINGYFTIYQKQFDVTFERDGISYGIAYPAVHPDSRIPGQALGAGDGFTVHEAVFYPGEAEERTEWVADIPPRLRAEGYHLFDDGADHADIWRVLLSLE